MGYEDTVIKGRVKQELIINWSNTITGHFLGIQPTLEYGAQEKVDAWIREIRLEQAKITGDKVIKEVVEWIEEHKIHFNHNLRQWKAFLKERGIEQ